MTGEYNAEKTWSLDAVFKAHIQNNRKGRIAN